MALRLSDLRGGICGQFPYSIRTVRKSIRTVQMKKSLFASFSSEKEGLSCLPVTAP
jgi:hypothetical protein